MEEISEIEKLFEDCLPEAKNKIKKYSIDLKLKVLKLLDLNVSMHKIEDRLGINRKSIREWRDKKNLFLDINAKSVRYRCNRVKGLNTIFSEEEELKIKLWIIECRKQLCPISTKSLVAYASKMKEDFNIKHINVKLRWAYRFLKRYGFSIRRITHLGQFIPRLHSEIKKKFIENIISARKKLNIDFDQNDRIINMDETPCYLDMNYETTIDFRGQKNIEIQTSGRENYRISVLLSITGNGDKLPPLIIVKGEEGKYIEKNLNTLYFVKNKSIFVRSQKSGWCTSELFATYIKEIFLPYQKNLGEKCLLIMDQASSHVSNESIEMLNNNEVSYYLIPVGMTPECQPLDISINKKFKDNIKRLFEENRLFFDKLSPKVKLQKARLNLIDFINRVWYDDNIITKFDIVNGFNHAGLTNIKYISNEEQKIMDGYLYDIFGFENNAIIDDLGEELNIKDGNDIGSDENYEEEKGPLEGKNVQINNISELNENKESSDEKCNNIDNLDFIEDKMMDIENDVNKDIKLNNFDNLYKKESIKEDLSNLNNVFNQESNEALFNNINKIDNYSYEKMDLED